MDDMEKYLNERLEKDEEFKKIWQEETIKREVIKMLIEMRIKEGLTQKELAERLEVFVDWHLLFLFWAFLTVLNLL